MRFNVRDVIKVKTPVGRKHLKNQIGKIVSVDELCEDYAVGFENNIDGHTCDCEIENGHGWWVSDHDDIELVISSFSVGDRVKVINAGCVYSSYQKWVDYHVPYTLAKHWDKHNTPKTDHTFVVKVIAVHDDGFNIAYIKSETTGKCYIMGLEGLEKVEDKKVFTKADLKNGMIVEYRNGDRRFVLNDIVFRDGTFNRFDGYHDDLTDNMGYDHFDIVKVFESVNVKNFENIFNDEHLKLIWERPEEVKEMTIGEIEKELGYKIKVVKE